MKDKVEDKCFSSSERYLKYLNSDMDNKGKLGNIADKKLTLYISWMSCISLRNYAELFHLWYENSGNDLFILWQFPYLSPQLFFWNFCPFNINIQVPFTLEGICHTFLWELSLLVHGSHFKFFFVCQS